MECYPLDITLISAEGLKDVNTFSKMDVYAVVTILGYPKTKNRTHVDRNGGTNPRWNHHMKFTIDQPSLNNPGISLLIQLKSDRTFGSDKEIGEINVPISELFNGGDTTKDSGERVVEYQVRTSSGKPKGTLKFSYKFGKKFMQQQVEAKKKNVFAEPVTAYPAPQHAAGASMAYPPPYQGYAVPPPGYQQPHGAGGYAPQHPGYGGYPPAGYPGYPPTAAPGYGYPPHPGYGYPPQPYQQVQPPKKNKSKMGLGMGLGAGLLGGLLVGDMISDVGEMGAYNEGYDDAMGDIGDF